MKRTVVTASGDVVCPTCGARNQFVQKRTGKAKLAGVATVGVGVLAMPKRLKCSGCGTNLKRGRRPASVGVAPSRGAYVAVAVVLVLLLVGVLAR